MKSLISKIGLSIIACLVAVLVVFNLTSCKKDEGLKTIHLGEVTHSAFYAPLYVAIEKDYFKDAGIDIDLSLISGANNVTAAVLSGDVEVGFCGPEATIYVYNGGEKDYVQTFAGMTKRDGQFIVSREDIKDFSWDDLKGKKVLAGRIGGMPELNFENALKNAKVSESDVKIDTSVDFASLSSAFIGGDGDFVNLFEPNATKITSMGYGHVVASIGKMSGEMPYTAFNAKKSFIEANRKLLVSFTDAVDRGLKFVHENDAKTVAEAIIGQFPDTSMKDLISIIDRYKEADSWLLNPTIEEKLFENLEDIMIDSKQISKYVPFEDLVVNLYE